MRKRILWLGTAVALLLPLSGTGCGKQKTGDPKLVGPPDPTAQPIGNSGVGAKGNRQNEGGNKNIAQ
jgi:hypothetical protein